MGVSQAKEVMIAQIVALLTSHEEQAARQKAVSGKVTVETMAELVRLRTQLHELKRET